MTLSTYRVYIDSFDSDLIWSVDQGDTSTERHFKTVCIDGISFANSNLKADNKKEPKAWIEIENAKLYEADGVHAYICQYLEKGSRICG